MADAASARGARRISWLRRAGWLPALLFAGCATAPPAPAPESALADNYLLRGRIAVRREDEQATLTLSWRQAGDRFDVRLSDRLGRTVLRAHGDEDRVEVEQPGEPVRRGPTESVLADLVGPQLEVPFPFDVLPWWLQGLPDPDRPHLGAGTHGWRQAGFVVAPEADGRIRGRQLAGPVAFIARVTAREACTASELSAC